MQVEISKAAIAETLLRENKRNIKNTKTVLHCQEIEKEFLSLDKNQTSVAKDNWKWISLCT